jgi:hypothetical protein
MKITNFNTDVAIQDQHSPLVDIKFEKHLESTTLSANYNIDDTIITVPDSTGFISGSDICITEDDRYFQAKVLSVAISAPNKMLTLDTPLDYDFTTSAIVKRCTQSLNIDGSGTTQYFHVKAPIGVKWDIVRIIFFIEDNNVMDSAKFGGMTALTKGIILRQKNGIYNNIFNIKSNGGLAARVYELEYDSKAPSGVYGLRAMRTFGGQDRNGVVVRLDGDTDEELQLIIQDDLTGLTKFEIVAQGHTVED